MADRALITGGAGFIGLHLAAALRRRGTEVTLLDDLSRGALDAEARAVLGDSELVRHDLTEPIGDDVLDDRFDQVFHLAAIVGVRRVAEAPHEVLRTNLLSTLHLLDWCARHRPRRLLLSSTSEVGDGAAKTGLAAVPVGESAPAVIPDPALPRSSYAVSKLASEALVRHWGAEHGVGARIVRYHNVYGPRMGRAHVVPQLIERALEHPDPFTVYGPEQRRAFCFVDDAVAATLALMELDTDEPLLVNVGNDREEVEIADLARRILALAGCDAELAAEPAPAGSPARRAPDLERLRALTGYAPRVPLDEGLERTFAWYRAHLAEARTAVA